VVGNKSFGIGMIWEGEMKAAVIFKLNFYVADGLFDIQRKDVMRFCE
jgi:hypothetical protein